MAKQRTWNYNLTSGKKKKKKPVRVSEENIQMGSGEYLMHSPLNPMAKIGADYGTAIPRIVQTSTVHPFVQGVYFPSGNRTFEAPLNESEKEFFQKAKNLPGATVTDTEKMAGSSSRLWLLNGSKKTYGKDYHRTPLRPEKKGTGYKATSRPKDVIGLDPHNYQSFPISGRDEVGVQPKSYGGLRSYESKYMEGRGYLGDTTSIYGPKQSKEKEKYKSAMSQLDTLDHELQHRGFAKWRTILSQDTNLQNKLLKKYGEDHPVFQILDGDRDMAHAYIYSQSTDPYNIKNEKKITRQVKEAVDQEILPYFFKRIPSLKNADSLQGPAYGDVKGRGTTMKKRKYQTKKKRGTDSYAVKTRGKYVDDDKNYTSSSRVYKGSWNY